MRKVKKLMGILPLSAVCRSRVTANRNLTHSAAVPARGEVELAFSGIEAGCQKPSCELDVRPTDAEAAKYGFPSAEAWYVYSAGLIGSPPEAARLNFHAMLAPYS